MRNIQKFVVVFIVLISLLFFSAQAEEYDIVLINSATSDRVHLRQQANADSKSLGLYFSGTHAVILEEGEDWSYVLIGTERGYVYNSLLSKEIVTPKARLGTVVSNGTLNLRTHPSREAHVVARLAEGQQITLLGETHDHWYLVRTDKGYGYVMNSYVRTDGYAPDETSSVFVPEELQGRWYFSSGAGAWQTVMTVFPDGSFWGYYHDSDMGDSGTNYPNGTAYECLFTGEFSQITQANEYEYRMIVDNYNYFGIQGFEQIINKVRTRTISSAGICDENLCSLYLADFPTDQLSEEALFQYRGYLSYIHGRPALLYNHTTEAGFIPD